MNYFQMVGYFDLRTRAPICLFSVENPQPIWSIALDEPIVVSGDDTGSITVWDVRFPQNPIYESINIHNDTTMQGIYLFYFLHIILFHIILFRVVMIVVKVCINSDYGYLLSCGYDCSLKFSKLSQIGQTSQVDTSASLSDEKEELEGLPNGVETFNLVSPSIGGSRAHNNIILSLDVDWDYGLALTYVVIPKSTPLQ